MTEEFTPLSLSEIQRKAQEDVVASIASSIYQQITRRIEQYPANRSTSMIVYARDYHETDCFRHIQGFLHEELTGLFPETTISIKYAPNNAWWRYPLLCCCFPETFVSESLTIDISW
jgi:hypothetical protein